MSTLDFWIVNVLICAAIAIAAGLVVMGALALAGYCRHKKTFQEEEGYVTVMRRQSDPEQECDENLMRSAELHSYQEAKANIIAKEKAKRYHEMRTGFESDQESDPDGEIFVYELPGIAAPGDMNVPNPFFDDTDSGSFEEEGSDLRRFSSQSYSSSSRGSQRSDFNSP